MEEEEILSQAASKEATEMSEDAESSEGEEPEKGKKNDDRKVKLFEDRYFEVDNEPPKLVVVQGPPGSGKTTLIRSLVRHYTKQTISDPKGPITVRTGKKQRVTFLECPNDMGSMADLSNVADIVLLTIDGSIGFEMQTFEFLSLLQVKGFPRCMGVLTHLDTYQDNKKMKKLKKFFKRRFDDETTAESKLFFTGGFKNKYYLHQDVNNIARFLSVILPRKTDWKKEHPHLLVDRIELLSEGMLQDEDTVDVAVFGYARGSTFFRQQQALLVGLGRRGIKDLKVVQDPCPALEKPVEVTKNETEFQGETNTDEPERKKGKPSRTLELNQRLLYAPQSNVGVLAFDETGGYVTIPDKFVIFTKREDEADEHGQHEGVRMMRELQQTKKRIDKELDDGEVELLAGIPVKEVELKKEYISFQNSLKTVSNIAEQVAKFEGITAVQTKYVNLFDKIYNEKDESLNGIMDVGKFVPTELNSREWYVKNARRRFITGIDALAEDPAALANANAEETDPDYTEVEKQALLSKDQGRINLGDYIRLGFLRIKFKHFKNFTSKPLIVSFPTLQIDTMGFALVRFKKHRFYTNLLKSFDPVILSAGFYKYQSIPHLAKKDSNDRMRLLKYTPQHDFCLMAVYSPFLELNTGVAVFQSIDEGIKKFRVAGTGVVIGFAPNYDIKKKLRLVGEPFKIFKNTCFVRNMFNSRLELAKFIGAKVKTISGIRGQIKKTTKEGPDGSYRATFEDKVLMTDVIFCNTWYSIPLESFYNPVVSFDENLLMQTTWQLRMKYGIRTPGFRNSYEPIEHVEKQFTPIVVPKKLEEALPLRTKDKIKTASRLEQVRKEERSALRPLMSDQEKKAISLVQRLKSVEKDRKERKVAAFKEKMKVKGAWEQGMKKDRTDAVKKLKKAKHAKKGVQEKRKAQAKESRD